MPGMSQDPSPAPSPVEHGELIPPTAASDGEQTGASGAEPEREFVSEPAKVMRVGSMIKQLLDEVRSTPLDEPARERLRVIFERSIDELGSALSPDLREELDRLALTFSDDAAPTDVELRIAQAQLVGWLEGLFHGIQATLFAQQMAARQQLENMRGELVQGRGAPGQPGPVPPDASQRPGTYL
jgi:Protein of unknown function (DUF2587)